LFNDDWITKREKHNGSSNFDLLGVINSATWRKNGKEYESDEEKLSNYAEMVSRGTWDDLEIQIDVNLENSRSFELNNIENIGIGTSSSTSDHNIGINTSSDTNNPLDSNNIDECLRNNEKNEDNKVGFSLHNTPTNCQF